MEPLMLGNMTKIVLKAILTPSALSSISGPYGMIVSNLLKNVSLDSLIDSLAASLPPETVAEIETLLHENGYVKA